MQLVELPSRDKSDLKSRRQLASQGAKSASASSTNKSWILVSTLPERYKRDPRIVTPTNAGGSREAEASYTALYTFVISVIYLNNGILPEAKLDRYLKRVNAETYTSLGATEKLLARMVKEGYVEKRRDTSTGEENIEWVVGPRGKVEVGIKGVQGLVKGVYGFGGTRGPDMEDEDEEKELDRKLKRSLGIREEGPKIIVENAGAETGNGGAEAEPEQPRRRGDARRRPRRAATRGSRSDDDDE
jgi:DNA-binding MarR family transcriptional regulator